MSQPFLFPCITASIRPTSLAGNESMCTALIFPCNTPRFQHELWIRLFMICSWARSTRLSPLCTANGHSAFDRIAMRWE